MKPHAGWYRRKPVQSTRPRTAEIGVREAACDYITEVVVPQAADVTISVVTSPWSYLIMVFKKSAVGAQKHHHRGMLSVRDDSVVVTTDGSESVILRYEDPEVFNQVGAYLRLMVSGAVR